MHYSGRDGLRCTVFEITAGRVDVGGDIGFLSQYPGEREFLMQPLSCLEVRTHVMQDGPEETQTHGHTERKGCELGTRSEIRIPVSNLRILCTGSGRGQAIAHCDRSLRMRPGACIVSLSCCL